MLKHGHLTDLFTSKEWEDRFRTPQIAINQLTQHDSQLFHRQNHQSFDALGQHFEVRKLRSDLTDSLNVLSVEILTVYALEIISKDIKNLQFFNTIAD